MTHTQAKHPGQRSVSWKRTDGRTQPIALPYPVRGQQLR